MPDDDANQAAILNATILHFSRVGSAAKTLLLLAATALCFFLIYDAGKRASTPTVHRVLVLSDASQAPTDPFLTDATLVQRPPKQPGLIMVIQLVVTTFGAIFALFYVGRFAMRTVTNRPAAKIEGGQILFHSSYSSAPATLGLEDVTVVIFDRADRMTESASQDHSGAYSMPGFSAARLGSKMRHTLYIGFLADGSEGKVLLIDNDIEGGTEQLRRFAAQVDIRRRSSVDGHG